MIKGLFFKLNLENENDNEIWKFFIETPAKEKCTKIELLFRLIKIYKSL